MNEIHFPFPTVKTKLRFFKSEQGFYRALKSYETFPLLVDSGIRKFLPAKLQKRAFILPRGEACKDWKTLEKVLVWLSSLEIDRQTPLLVIGGGAACDLGAFAAALYRRGIPLVLVPTTLLAQVDASVGGKSAIDLKSKNFILKNFAGVFCPAETVLLSEHWLESLPIRERKSGMGEVLKALYLVGEKPHVEAMQIFVQSGKVTAKLQTQIRAALAFKAKIVRRDPLDKKRIRECLNFGHTVGHALEAASQGSLTHGEAVALGLYVETLFGGNAHFARRILTDLQALGFPFSPALKKVPAKLWEKYFRGDKKMATGKLAITIATDLGGMKKLEVSPRELALFFCEALKDLDLA